MKPVILISLLLCVGCAQPAGRVTEPKALNLTQAATTAGNGAPKAWASDLRSIAAKAREGDFKANSEVYDAVNKATEASGAKALKGWSQPFGMRVKADGKYDAEAVAKALEESASGFEKASK